MKQFIVDGKKKYLKKLEFSDLLAMGIAETALLRNYNFSDFSYYTDLNEKNIYEVLYNTVCGYWDIDIFTVWFNEV